MNSTVDELLGIFAAGLAQVFETMAEQRPEVSCEPSEAPPETGEILWWEQPLTIDPAAKVWAGAPHGAWEEAGRLTLAAAGLDSVEESESRSTWLEILGQALSALARAIGGVLGREVSCNAGSEHAPEPGVEGWTAVKVSFGEKSLPPLYIGFSPRLSEALSAASAAVRSPDPSDGIVDEDDQPAMPMHSRTMRLLLDVDLPVSISFGKTQLAMRDVIKLTTGSIVELNRGVSEPVDVLVNGALVARGEVVVVEGNYGVRILEIASRSDRMRTLR